MGKCCTRKLGGAVGLILWAGSAFADCATDTVQLRTLAGAVVRFSIELADDDQERELGLMNRTELPSSSAMLFAYPAPKHAWFWMKNTLIPLDMIFADATGLVTNVHSNAVPLDETPIDGGEGVTYVLEINGGLAKRMGIDRGSVLRADVIDQNAALWSCQGD